MRHINNLVINKIMLKKGQPVIQVQCEPLLPEFIGRQIEFDGHTYFVENSTVLSTPFIATKGYDDAVLFSIMYGLSPKLIDGTNPYPTLNNNYKSTPVNINGNSMKEALYLPGTLLEDTNQLVVGQKVTFYDQYGKLIIGRIQNEMGAITVPYEAQIFDFKSRQVATGVHTSSAGLEDLQSFVRNLNLSLETDMHPYNNPKPVPSTELDKINMSQFKGRNFVYLDKDEIIRATDSQADTAFYNPVKNVSSSAKDIYIGSIVLNKSDNHKYILSASDRVIDLEPQYQIQKLIGTPYVGSPLQEKTQANKYKLSIDDIPVVSLTQVSNNLFGNDALRWSIELPKDYRLCLANLLIKNEQNMHNTTPPRVGDIVELKFDKDGKNRAKFVITDDLHLMSILPAEEMAFDLSQLKFNYQVSNYIETKTVKINDLESNGINSLFRNQSPNATEIIFDTENKHEANTISLNPGTDFCMNINFRGECIPIHFTAHYETVLEPRPNYFHNESRLAQRNTLVLQPIRDSNYQNNEVLFKLCLTEPKLKTIPGLTSIDLVLNMSHAQFTIDKELMRGHVYKCECSLEENTAKLNTIDTTPNDNGIQQTKSEYVRKENIESVLNQNLMSTISINISNHALPKCAEELYGDVVINGMRGHLVTDVLKLKTQLLPVYKFNVQTRDMLKREAIKIPSVSSLREYEKIFQTYMRGVLQTFEQNTGLVFDGNKSWKDKFLPDIPKFEWLDKGTKQQEHKTVVPVRQTKSKDTFNSALIPVLAGTAKSIEVQYTDLGKCEISILKEADVPQIPAQYLNRDVDYWIDSETKKSTGFDGIAFAMGKVIDTDSNIVEKDVILQAHVFPIIRTTALSQTKASVGDTIIVNAGNNMKDYYTMVSANILLRNEPLGQVELSNNFIMPDIAPGATISTYSSESPVFKLVQDYIDTLEHKEKYIIEQHAVIDAESISITTADNSKTSDTSTDIIQQIASIEAQTEIEKQKLQQAQQMVDNSLKNLIKLTQEASALKLTLQQAQTSQPEKLQVFGYDICEWKNIQYSGTIAHIECSPEIITILAANPIMKEKTKELIIAQNPEISNIHIFTKERELEMTQKR